MAVNLQDRALVVLEQQSDLGRMGVALIRRQRAKIQELEAGLEQAERAVRDQALQIERLQQRLAQLISS